jgi:hypothetical protein
MHLLSHTKEPSWKPSPRPHTIASLEKGQAQYRARVLNWHSRPTSVLPFTHGRLYEESVFDSHVLESGLMASRGPGRLGGAFNKSTTLGLFEVVVKSPTEIDHGVPKSRFIGSVTQRQRRAPLPRRPKVQLPNKFSKNFSGQVKSGQPIRNHF